MIKRVSATRPFFFGGGEGGGHRGGAMGKGGKKGMPETILLNTSPLFPLECLSVNMLWCIKLLEIRPACRKERQCNNYYLS